MRRFCNLISILKISIFYHSPCTETTNNTGRVKKAGTFHIRIKLINGELIAGIPMCKLHYPIPILSC